MAQPANTRNPTSESTTAAVFRLFVEAWKSGHAPSLEDALRAILPAYRGTLFPRLFEIELYYRRSRGESVSVEDYLDAFPKYEVEILALWSRQSDSLPLTGASTVSLFPVIEKDEASSIDILTEEPPLFRVGRYELERILGIGGFAAVWLARDPSLDRPVAIKLPRQDRKVPMSCAEMLQEARRIARLNLRGVVPVFDVVEESDRFYIVSQFMEGGTLAARIRDGRIPREDACKWIAAIADTLHQAHLKGIVHRDIKPSNVLLDQEGKPWVADFGLATTEAEQWQDCGMVLGTLAYMSPEQARGEGHLVDGRTDIYGLGMMLYEMLTGRVAFLGNSREELLEQIRKRSPRPPRSFDDSIPAELERICLKCLAKDVSARYSTAGDLANDLRHWLAGPSPAPPAHATKRSPLGYAAAGVAIAAVAVALAWFWRPLGLPTDAAATGVARPQESHEERLWIERLGQSPAELLWPGYRGTSTAIFPERARVFQVTSSAPRCFELGTINDDVQRISLNLGQPDWSEGCGVFFGYRETVVDEQPRAEFHAILIQPATDPAGEPALRIRRGQFYLSPRDGTIYPISEIGEQIAPWPAPDALWRMEVQLNDAGMLSGRWGRVEFHELIERHTGKMAPRDRLNGRWGILQESGTSWFQDPQIDSRGSL